MNESLRILKLMYAGRGFAPFAGFSTTSNFSRLSPAVPAGRLQRLRGRPVKPADHALKLNLTKSYPFTGYLRWDGPGLMRETPVLQGLL